MLNRTYINRQLQSSPKLSYTHMRIHADFPLYFRTFNYPRRAIPAAFNKPARAIEIKSTRLAARVNQLERAGTISTYTTVRISIKQEKPLAIAPNLSTHIYIFLPPIIIVAHRHGRACTRKVQSLWGGKVNDVCSRRVRSSRAFASFSCCLGE